MTALDEVRADLEHDPREDIPPADLLAAFTALMADTVAVALEYRDRFAITYRDREWSAVRSDGTGEPLRASTPGGLAELMRADLEEGH